MGNSVEIMRKALLEAANKEKTKVKKTTMFGQTVYLRLLDSEQRDSFEESKMDVQVNLVGNKTNGKASMNLKNLRARFVVMVLGDEHGNQIFDEKKDLHIIAKMPATETDKIYDEGMIFNGMDDEANDRAKKNFSQTEGSTT